MSGKWMLKSVAFNFKVKATLEFTQRYVFTVKLLNASQCFNLIPNLSDDVI